MIDKDTYLYWVNGQDVSSFLKRVALFREDLAKLNGTIVSKDFSYEQSAKYSYLFWYRTPSGEKVPDYKWDGGSMGMH